MTKKLYVLSQQFWKKKGSYSLVLRELSKEANKQGYNVIILCGLKSSQKKNEKFANGIIKRFKTMNLPAFGYIINAYYLGRQIKKYLGKVGVVKNDLIFANGDAALGALDHNFILRAGDQPAPIFLRNLQMSEEKISFLGKIARRIHLKLQEKIEERTIMNAAGVVFPSKKTRNHFCNLYGGEEKPYFIPRSGVNFSSFKKGKKLPIKGKKLLFVSAGRERIRKGVIYLERALPELFDKYEDLKLVHVGGKFGWNVPTKYKNRIITVGKVPWKKMKNYYATADIFINTSLSEGFPNTILEAMAAGCPVVTSDIDGIEEYITHKKEGYIFERGNIRKLKKGIEYLLNKKNFPHKISKNAQGKIKKINYENYNSKLLEFIEKINCNKKINVNLLK